MPYIRKDERMFLDVGNAGDNVGELTYSLQQELMKYLEGIMLTGSAEFREAAKEGRGAFAFDPQDDDYPKPEGVRYSDLMDCLKALDGARIDFITRIVQPYEERKRYENGDVWHPTLMKHLGLTGGPY